MANFDLHPAGSALFSGSENFLTDLSQEDESMITGGTDYDKKKKGSSDSNSGKNYKDKESS